jgi:hypothetical protein
LLIISDESFNTFKFWLHKVYFLIERMSFLFAFSVSD